MPNNAAQPNRGLKVFGAGALLVVSAVVLAWALGWRPLGNPTPPTEQVSSESLEQARQQDVEAQKQVDKGEVIIGGP